MARRRKRIKIKDSSLFSFIILNLLIAGNATHHNHVHNQHHHQHNQNIHHQHHQQQQQDYRASSQQVLTAGGNPSTAHLCSLLPAYVSKHLKLCKLVAHSPNANEAVALGASKGLAECRNQFKSERWNCTHAHGDHHLLTSELAQSVGNRESGFVHAIAAAGIVHSIATACSVGNLSDCACDKTRIGLIRRQEENWKWGGCSNNIRHGMLFAKHLVELLDAVHQHSQPSGWATGDGGQQRLRKRSLSSRHREPNQVRGLSQLQQLSEQSIVDSPTNNVLSFCQRNQNISQAVHFQLIKSLLSKNSLEKHQEFRLAMNMHNNKVGRMAVAKNMEFRCRCHGLSGSCSLKTCWLTLPNFQAIGDYLKRKYEGSVHLPSAVNVNKLIPMMDRNEISAILTSGQTVTAAAATSGTTTTTGAADLQEALEVPSSKSATASEPVPEFAPLVAPARAQLSGHFIVSPVGQSHNLSTSINTPPHYSYYERHKLQQLEASGQPTGLRHHNSTASHPNQHQNQNQRVQNSYLSQTTDEIPVNIAPMTQQQYQALLRDMKLCNTSATAQFATASHLTTRDLSQHPTMNENHQQQQITAALYTKPIYKKLNQSQHQNQLLMGLNGQHLKNANQHLSQLLHLNKDELIHLHKSPDYCEADARHGFAGIQSRVCSENPSAPDYCDKLCCGRGYSTRVYQHSFKCDCKFQYCCSIWCSVCEKEIKLLVCN